MVRLVEYSASSDDDRNSVVAADARCTDDDGQWSSCSSGELLSSPSDSFSYPMRSPFSDDEDEDYAPSMTSMEEEEEEEVESSSATSSMDTEDSDPDEEQDMDVEPQDTADVADDAEGNEGADEMVQAFHDTNLDNLGNTNHDGTKQGVEHTLGGRDRDAAKPVFYAWGDLQAAFQDAAYTRRSSSVSTTKMADGFPQPQNAGGGAVRDEQQTGKRFETSGTTSSGGGLEKGEWRAKAAFALGVAGKKEMPTRRRHSLSGATARHHGTGAIPKCSTVLHREQHQSTGHCPTTAGATEHLAATIKMKIAKTSLVGDEPISNVSVPQVEKADFTFGVQQAQVQTPDFTFGKHAPTEYGKAETANGEEACDDTYMNCPRSRCSATAPFNAGNSASTLEKRDNPMEAFDTSGTDDIGLAKVAAQMPSKPDIGCSAFVGNKSPRSESTSEAPASSKFLFGQAYKNHKPGFFAGRKRSELFHSTESVTSASYSAASTRASEDLKGANGLAGDFKIGKTGVSGEFIAPPTSFATGVAGPSMFRRNVPRRRKSSPSRPFPFGCPTSSQFVASTSCSNSAPSWTTTAFSQRYDSACAYDSTHHSTAQGKSTTPATFSGNQFAANKNVDAKMAPKTFSNPEPYSSGANEGFGSVFSERAECSTATSCIPPGSGETETSSQSRGPNFRFTEQQAKSMSAPTIGCGFQIGSVDVRRKTRVRPRKSGMFARKHSPRKDAKVGATEPMRSSSFFGSFSASPFSVRDNHGYAQKDAYQRKSGHSFLADPLAARNYQNLSPASPFVPLDGKRSPCTDKATVATEFASAATSTAGSVNGETTQQQGKTCDTNVSSSVLQKDKPSASQLPSAAHQSVFQQNKPGNCLKTQQTSNGATCPAYAGSRRILRAAVRNIGVRKERARSAPVSSGNRPEEGDAEMGSEDELDWREMKRLGGIAYCSKKYGEAVEYYRQSIELLDSLLYRGADTYTIEVRTDKARLHANRAASLMMMMQIAEAQRECQRSIEVDATYARAYLRLSRIQVLLGDTANAKANIDTARQLMEKQDDQVSSCDHIDRVSVLKTEAAIKKLTMLQSEIKSNIACGYYKQALMHTESALVLAPKSRKLQVEKARIFLHRRQLDHISKFCTSVVEKQQANSRKSQNPASRGGISTKSLKDEAVDMVTILGIDLGLLWATSLHYQNKVEDASRILDALEVVAPCSSHVIKLKRQWQDMEQLKRDGNARYKEGQYQEAVRHYSEALLIDPQHHEYCAVLYCNRSAAQMGLQRYHTALLDCNEALQRKPKFFRAMLRRARCHDRLKMHHEAVKDYDNYLREQSSDIPVSETANVARERDEAKAAIAKAREEARQREAAKKRAERQQRQQRPPCWEDASQNKSRPYDRYTRGAGTNGGSSKNQSSGDSSGASCAKTETRSRTYYEILAVSRTATSDQIKKSYRKLALSYHPDKSSALSHIELFKEMTAAYNVLSDKSTRDKYDRELIYNKFSAF